jgi:hypothetical protein
VLVTVLDIIDDTRNTLKSSVGLQVDRIRAGLAGLSDALRDTTVYGQDGALDVLGGAVAERYIEVQCGGDKVDVMLDGLGDRVGLAC